jgi:hypothetical protein
LKQWGDWESKIEQVISFLASAEKPVDDIHEMMLKIRQFRITMKDLLAEKQEFDVTSYNIDFNESYCALEFAKEAAKKLDDHFVHLFQSTECSLQDWQPPVLVRSRRIDYMQQMKQQIREVGTNSRFILQLFQKLTMHACYCYKLQRKQIIRSFNSNNITSNEEIKDENLQVETSKFNKALELIKWLQRSQNIKFAITQTQCLMYAASKASGLPRNTIERKQLIGAIDWLGLQQSILQHYQIGHDVVAAYIGLSFLCEDIHDGSISSNDLELFPVALKHRIPEGVKVITKLVIKEAITKVNNELILRTKQFIENQSDVKTKQKKPDGSELTEFKDDMVALEILNSEFSEINNYFQSVFTKNIFNNLRWDLHSQFSILERLDDAMKLQLFGKT